MPDVSFVFWALVACVAVALFMTYWREIARVFTPEFWSGPPKKLKDAMKNLKSPDTWDGICPSCGGKRWYEGPRGGMCVNITCSNRECRHRLNIGEMPWGPQIVNDLGKCTFEEWKDWTGEK